MFFLWPVKFFRIVVETTTSCSSGIFPLKLLCRHTLSIWRQSRLVIFFLNIAALTLETFDCFKQGTLVYTKDSQILINILCQLIIFFIELKDQKFILTVTYCLKCFVQAIAWSPHHHGLLASGGGTADRCIRFWNTLTGQAMQSVDTGSQVLSSYLWLKIDIIVNMIDKKILDKIVVSFVVEWGYGSL